MLRPTATVLILALAGLAIRPFPRVEAAPPKVPPLVTAWQQYEDSRDAGWNPEALEATRLLADREGSEAVMLVYRGRVVAAWGDVTRRFHTYSIRKSLVSLLYGMAIRDGRIDIDQTLGDLGIDDDTRLTAVEKRARVRDLLAARSGVYLPAAWEPPGNAAARPERGSHAPGTSWYYNNWDFNVLATIYQLRTQQNVLDAIRTRLVEPLGFEDYRARETYFIREPKHSRHPAYELHLSARDLARVGVLVANDGQWEGATLVPASWLAESLSAKTRFESGGGYGYLWWITPEPPSAKNAFRNKGETFNGVTALGNGGQMVLVVPSIDLVLVHLSPRVVGRATKGDMPREIARRLLEARIGPAKPDARLKPLAAVPMTNPAPPTPEHTEAPLSANVRDVTGDYRVTPDFVARVELIDGGLFVDMPGRGQAELFQEAPDRFFLKITDVVLTFQRNDAGQVTAVEVNDGGRVQRLPKVK